MLHTSPPRETTLKAPVTAALLMAVGIVSAVIAWRGLSPVSETARTAEQGTLATPEPLDDSTELPGGSACRIGTEHSSPGHPESLAELPPGALQLPSAPFPGLSTRELERWPVGLLRAKIGRWTRRDPRSVARWAAELPDSPASREVVSQIVIDWGQVDLAAATDWARQIPVAGNRQAAISSLAYEAVRTEPQKALELSRELPSGIERENLAIHAVSQWAAVDSTEAVGWANGMADTGLRPKLLAAAAVAVAERDGRAGAELAAQWLGQGEEADRAAVGIVQRWAQKSPEQAAEWVSRFPEGAARNAAVEALVVVWKTLDSRAVDAWLDRLPEASAKSLAGEQSRASKGS